MIYHSPRSAAFFAILTIGAAFVGCGFNTAASTQIQSDEVPAQGAVSSSAQPTTDFNFESPQAVFSVAQAAAKDNDIPRILECHSRETQGSLATHVILGAAMMRLVASKFAERGDDRYAKSKYRVDSILEKYGVDLSDISRDDLQPGITNLDSLRRKAAEIDNQLMFITELLTELEAAKGTKSSGFQDELNGELIDVKIGGAFAEGSVVTFRDGKQVSRSIYFKNAKNGWRIHMPTE